MRKLLAILLLGLLLLATSVVYEEYPKLSNNNETTPLEMSTREEASEQTSTKIKDNSPQTALPDSLIELYDKEVIFQEEPRGFIPCPKWLDIKWRQVVPPNKSIFLNFTVFINGSPRLNLTLKGFFGSHFCTPEGIAIYGYYGRESSTIAFFNYNLTPLWRTEHEGLPVAYKNGTIVFLGEECIYLINAKTGSLHDRMCVGEPISAFKFMGDRVYITAAHPKGMTHLYVFEGNSMKEASITNISTFELVGRRIHLDVNKRYVAVAYFLYPTDGAERNGVCVFEADSLRRIACKEFEEGERPMGIKLEGNIVYILTERGIRAYKITGPE